MIRRIKDEGLAQVQGARPLYCRCRIVYDEEGIGGITEELRNYNKTIFH